MKRRLLPLVVATLVVATAGPASAIIPPDTHCRRGKVSITFDDGPSEVNTPKLLEVLREHRAQATFFVQGQHADRLPKILRAAVRDGHAVENHSWDHPDLALRPTTSVRRQLHLTQMAVNRAIGRRPGLFRPPYGASSPRVRAIAKRYGLRQQLWTIDTRDWTGKSRKAIAASALKGLRPHRSNVILMHDGVVSAPTTIKAVPSVVRSLRKKGYCLVPLEQMMPRGVVTAHDVSVPEGVEPTQPVPVTFRLDGPSQRAGSFRVRTIDGTAVAGEDYRPVRRRVHVRRGDRSVTIHVLMTVDPEPGTPQRLSLRLDEPRHLRLGTSTVAVETTDPPAEWDAGTLALIRPSGRVATTLVP